MQFDKMKRREFITLVGGAAAWPCAAGAQQGGQSRRIGVLTRFTESDAEVRVWLAAFEAGLQRLGWQKDRNISIDYRWPGNDESRLRSDVAQFATTPVDVILTTGSPALTALHREVHTVPIVFVQVSDPVKLGLVANLARPGGNITGFSNFEHAIGGKWLELLKDTAPATARAAVIFDPDDPSQPAYLQAIEAAAPSFGIELMLAGVRNADEIERTIATFALRPQGALIAVPNAVVIRDRDLIIALAARHRLPAVYPYRMFTRSSGLISYGTDVADLYRRAAGYVDLILKGAKPGDLPVQLPTKFEFVVNLKTARALGLTIPEPFLQAADEVIE